MRTRLLLASTLTLLAAPLAAQQAVDARLPPYTKTSGVTGAIKSVGSDTMNNLMTLWTEGFRAHYPNVQIAVEGKGSATAPPALIAGTASFGPMSRAMKDKEIDDFEKAFGYKPTVVRTGIDMLAVYVHRDNPIAQKGLTLQQVDAIFSKTRKGGFEHELRTWGDVGLTGEWADKPISLYGRNSASGTYGFFKEHALFKGDFKDSVKEQAGSSAVVQAVATDKFAVGYSGIGYKTADVVAVPLADEEGGAFHPAAEAALDDYPLTRFLYVYLNYKPGTAIDPLRGEFLKFVFSADGQRVVITDGYLPVSAEIARSELAQVGIAIELKTP